LETGSESRRQTIWIADANRDDGKRFVVHSDEKLSAFLELERATANDSPWINTERFGTIHMTPLLSDFPQASSRVRPKIYVFKDAIDIPIETFKR
jgi:hypothetical protein